MNPQHPNHSLVVLSTVAQEPAWSDTSPPPQPCLLCRCSGLPKLLPDSACANCGSPLCAPPTLQDQGQEQKGRRGAARRDRNNLAILQQGWPSTPVPVRWRDLSNTGLSILVEQMIDIDEIIRVTDKGIDAVAQVVECRNQGRLYSVHGRILRVRHLQSSGSLVPSRT